LTSSLREHVGLYDNYGGRVRMSSSARLAALLVVLFVLSAMPTGSVSAAAYPEPRPPSVHAGHLYRSAELKTPPQGAVRTRPGIRQL